MKTKGRSGRAERWKRCSTTGSRSQMEDNMMKRVTMIGAMAVLLALGQNAAWAQATITVDGDVSEWTEDMRLDVPPNRPIITWQDGADGRDNSPADPEDLEYMVDLNFAGLYATDDEEN